MELFKNPTFFLCSSISRRNYDFPEAPFFVTLATGIHTLRCRQKDRFLRACGAVEGPVYFDFDVVDELLRQTRRGQ